MFYKKKKIYFKNVFMNFSYLFVTMSGAGIVKACPDPSYCHPYLCPNNMN